MIHSIGLDLVDIDRIRDLQRRFDQRLTDRLLGPDEQSLLENARSPHQFVAGRFAAKEAIVKGLGKWLEHRPPWKEMQILNDSSGQPYVAFSDDITKAIPTISCLISITHERTHAAAVAIFTDGKP